MDCHCQRERERGRQRERQRDIVYTLMQHAHAQACAGPGNHSTTAHIIMQHQHATNKWTHAQAAAYPQFGAWRPTLLASHQTGMTWAPSGQQEHQACSSLATQATERDIDSRCKDRRCERRKPTLCGRREEGGRKVLITIACKLSNHRIT